MFTGGFQPRLAALSVAVVIGLPGLLILGGCVPKPPAIDTTGLDPAVVPVIHTALSEVKKSPRSGEAWGQLGSVLMHYEFPAETSSAFSHAERLAPSDPRWPHLHGLALSATELAGATEQFRRAASLATPEFDSPALHLAQLQAERGFNAEAEAGFAALLGRQPQHAPALLGLARFHLAAGRARDTTNLLGFCLRDPHTARAAHTLMASAQQALTNTTAAKQFAANATTLPADAPWPDPWWTEALRFRVGRKAMVENATSLMDQGKLVEAMPLLDRTTRDYPADAEAWYLAGWAMVQQQRPVEGERALREHLRLAPQSPKGHAQLAVALLMQQRHAEAAEVLRTGVALKPTWRELRSNLGFACVQLGRQDEALAHYREALALDPNHVPSHTALAELLMRRGDQAEARQLLQQALEIDPSDPRTRGMLDRLGPTR
jgi:tetratricopeptide (TPR) repeat protein